MRLLIEYVLPLLLPSLIWVVWLAHARRRASRRGETAGAWRDVPWTWLLAAGLALAMVLAAGGVLRGGYHRGAYSPARIDQEGHVVPGGFH